MKSGLRTKLGNQESLTGLFTGLNALPGTLLVFCHPLWDLASVGEAEPARQRRRFLAAHGSHLRAVELNGYRSRKENAGAQHG